MRIATCLNADGSVGMPFEAGSVRVYERGADSWEEVQKFDYFPVPDMGVDHARLLLRGIASEIRDCDVFLVSELRGYAHVWLGELGFRAWKSEGALSEQLERVAELDALDESRQAFAAPGTMRGISGMGCGCGGGSAGCSPAGSSSAVSSSCGDSRCGGRCGSGNAPTFDPGLRSAEGARIVPSPQIVGDPSSRNYRIDLASVLAADPMLNSMEVLVPFLEEGSFSRLEVRCDHLPRWFPGAMDRLSLAAEYAESDDSGLVVWITPDTRGLA